MLSAKLVEYLEENRISYATVPHPAAQTAHQVATLTQTPDQEIAKTVMIKVDGDLAMAVVPASRDVDLEKLEVLLGADRVRLAGESDFKRRFPDCETGAMPPFGNLYGMKVYVDESLTKDMEIGFDAGSHSELIRIAYADFERLVKPIVLKFSAAHVKRYWKT